MNKLIFFIILIVVSSVMIALPPALVGCGGSGLHIGEIVGNGSCGGSAMAELHIHKFKSLYLAVITTASILFFAAILRLLALAGQKDFDLLGENSWQQAARSKHKGAVHIKFYEPLFRALASGLINKKHLDKKALIF